MAFAPTIETERLSLRRWRDSDLKPFAAMNADPCVMEYFPGTLSAHESDALTERIVEHFDEHDFGLWAVEVKGVADFAGFIGLSIPSFEAHFTPCVEIGWRLACNHWGHGYATEGAPPKFLIMPLSIFAHRLKIFCDSKTKKYRR